MNGDTVSIPDGGGSVVPRRRRGRPRKVRIEDALLRDDGEDGLAKSCGEKNRENVRMLRRILRGEYPDGAERYISRDIVVCRLARWAFGEGVPMNYAISALHQLIEMLRLAQKSGEGEIGVNPVLLGDWAANREIAELDGVGRADVDAAARGGCQEEEGDGE